MTVTNTPGVLDTVLPGFVCRVGKCFNGPIWVENRGEFQVG